MTDLLAYCGVFVTACLVGGRFFRHGRMGTFLHSLAASFAGGCSIACSRRMLCAVNRCVAWADALWTLQQHRKISYHSLDGVCVDCTFHSSVQCFASTP